MLSAALDVARQRRGAGCAENGDVLTAFAQQIEGDPSPMTPERFKAIMNEVKAKTGAKGKELFHPVRIVADRIALRAGVRQADPDPGGRFAAQLAASRDECSRALGRFP